MNNLKNQSYQQLMQLDAQRLMPASWGGAGQAPGYGNSCDPCSGVNGPQGDWYSYAPTKAGFQRYIMAQGPARVQQFTRNAMGRVMGAPNLLRTQPPVPVSRGAAPWFNDSEFRQDIASSLGCGPAAVCTW